MTITDITMTIIPRTLSDGSVAHDLELEQDGQHITLGLFQRNDDDRKQAAKEIASVIEEATLTCVDFA